MTLDFIKISSFAIRGSDISSCIKHCKSMMVCKGITFNREQCRLKYKMVDSVKMSTNIIRTVHSVRLSCAQDLFVNEMHESSSEVMLLLMMILPIPGIVIIIMITVLVMISWRIRRRETTTTVIQEIVEDSSVVKSTFSVYENPTFDC